MFCVYITVSVYMILKKEINKRKKGRNKEGTDGEIYDFLVIKREKIEVKKK